MDDRLRGGSSTSHLETMTLTSGSRTGGVRFYGDLDTKTLGGAGFASQSYRHAVPLAADEYKGISFIYQPKTSPAAKEPTRFTFILKSALISTRLDGRRESTISYEYTFDSSNSACDKLENTSGPVPVELRIPFRDFQATYRGRPQPDAEPLDSAEIKELSIMCRSDFDKQSGPFELIVESIGAIHSESREGLQDLYGEKTTLVGRAGAEGSSGVLVRLSSLIRGLCG